MKIRRFVWRAEGNVKRVFERVMVAPWPSVGVYIKQKFGLSARRFRQIVYALARVHLCGDGLNGGA